MFSLIITVIAIALVAALAIATIYYGGTSLNKGSTRASAVTLITQSTQIASAGALSQVDGNGWPAGRPAFTPPYLNAMPQPPKGAYTNGAEPRTADWEYYLPGEQSKHFALHNKINRAVCMAVNRETGFHGIPAAWDGTSIVQCFGTGVDGQYTFFYDPPGTSPTEREAALEQSLQDGGTTTPGYPRLCPDGSTISSGACPVSDGNGGPDADVGDDDEAGSPTGPRLFKLSAYPRVLNTQGITPYGDTFVTYCSDDAPEYTFTTGSTLLVAGAPVTITGASDYCVDVESGHPAMAAGSYSVEVANSDGTRAVGTVKFVEEIEPTPELYSADPNAVPYNQTTRVIITGANFTPQTVFTNGVSTLKTRYIDATHFEVDVPPAKEFGYTEDKMYVGTGWMGGGFIVYNPNSDETNVSMINFYGTDVRDPGDSEEEPGEEPGGGNGLPSNEECQMSPWMEGCERTEYPPTEEECLENPGLAVCDASQYPALHISGLSGGYYTTFTAVKDCSFANTGYGGFCVPKFNSKHRVWQWDPSSDAFREDYQQATDGRKGFEDSREYGFNITDGVNSYSLYESYVRGSTYTYSTIEEHNPRPMGIPGGLTRMGVDCATVKATIESQGGEFVPNKCDTIQTGAQYSWTFFFSDSGSFYGFDSELNPDYTTNRQNWGPFEQGYDNSWSHMTIHAPSGINNHPLVIGFIPHPYSRRIDQHVSAGTRAGWPYAPLDTDLEHGAGR